MRDRAHVLLLTGAPGTGKTTRRRQLCTQEDHVSWPSWTTRPARPGEIDGLDYVFVTRQRFEAALAAGELLEHVELPNQHVYGLPRLRDRLDGVTYVAIVGYEVVPNLAASLAPLRVEVQALKASDAERHRRMTQRGDSAAEIDIRLRLG
jgi:guanylate kinase